MNKTDIFNLIPIFNKNNANNIAHICISMNIMDQFQTPKQKNKIKVQLKITTGRIY